MVHVVEGIGILEKKHIYTKQFNSIAHKWKEFKCFANINDSTFHCSDQISEKPKFYAKQQQQPKDEKKEECLKIDSTENKKRKHTSMTNYKNRTIFLFFMNQQNTQLKTCLKNSPLSTKPGNRSVHCRYN